jgi:TPR repeat protein
MEKDAAAALPLLRRAAEQDERDAQYRLALEYGRGGRVEKSNEEAMAWLRKAAALRHPDAEFLLGIAYSRGLYGLARDDVEAVKWLRRSARQNHAEAMYALGAAYAEGRGVNRDSSEALGWMLEASSRRPQRSLPAAAYPRM